MKAHKIEIIVLDFEGYGVEEYETMIEQSGAMTGFVLSSKTADIGVWDDDHPLNSTGGERMTEVQELFGEKPSSWDGVTDVKFGPA